jgi:hypothetical protein
MFFSSFLSALPPLEWRFPNRDNCLAYALNHSRRKIYHIQFAEPVLQLLEQATQRGLAHMVMAFVEDTNERDLPINEGQAKRWINEVYDKEHKRVDRIQYGFLNPIVLGHFTYPE